MTIGALAALGTLFWADLSSSERPSCRSLNFLSFGPKENAFAALFSRLSFSALRVRNDNHEFAQEITGSIVS